MLWDILVLSMGRRSSTREVLLRVGTAVVIGATSIGLSRSVAQAEDVNVHGSRNMVQKTNPVGGCDQLASERTNGRYWDPMLEEYSNVPWFKDERDPDPHNSNVSIQAENESRRRCGLPPLEMVNLSSTNPDVDLSSGSGVEPPRVRGMRFKAYLCEPPECYAGSPLYVRSGNVRPQNRR